MVLLEIFVSTAVVLAVFGLAKIARFIHGEITSPVRDLPGPKRTSLLFGNLKEIWGLEDFVVHEEWVAEHGNTIKVTGLLGMNHLYTVDPKAINHVLMNSYDYQKPPSARISLSRILGAGVLVVEGDKHKQQRKIMNPAFGHAQVRELTEIFVQKAIQLRDVWASESDNQGGVGRIDVLPWLSRMTLDVIGLAGFNYKFDALSATEKPNELSQAFDTMFHAGNTALSIFYELQSLFPILRLIKTKRDRQIKHAQETMARIGNHLLSDSKAALITGSSTEKDSLKSRDLLSLLVRANMAPDVRDNQRLSDEDVLAQVPTFLVAGHETTSTGTIWALYALTQNLAAQTKLRDELLSVPTENPTMDELNALPYLDYVVRETMRLHAPVPATGRVAMKDDILPLSTPFTDSHGNKHHSLRIVKGQGILIPIFHMNWTKSLWGEDSMEFKPERWESIPEAVGSIPGAWGNMLTFIGGPRACIGFRFSLVETKALLFTLIRAFEFELAVPAKDIIKKSGTIVQRPVLVTDPKGGNVMPLLVKPYHRA